MNNCIVIVDNTNKTWIVAQSTMHEFYEILNGFLIGERDMDGETIPHDTINHLIAWLPNIESIVINSNNDQLSMEVRFKNGHVLLNCHSLSDYFIEMMNDGEL